MSAGTQWVKQWKVGMVKWSPRHQYSTLGIWDLTLQPIREQDISTGKWKE